MTSENWDRRSQKSIGLAAAHSWRRPVIQVHAEEAIGILEFATLAENRNRLYTRLKVDLWTLVIHILQSVVNASD